MLHIERLLQLDELLIKFKGRIEMISICPFFALKFAGQVAQKNKKKIMKMYE